MNGNARMEFPRLQLKRLTRLNVRRAHPGGQREPMISRALPNIHSGTGRLEAALARADHPCLCPRTGCARTDSFAVAAKMLASLGQDVRRTRPAKTTHAGACVTVPGEIRFPGGAVVPKP